MKVPRSVFVIPDEETWVVSGAERLEPRVRITAEPAGAELLLLPERVPNGLADAVRAAWSRMPPGKELRTYASALPGVPAAEAVREGAEAAWRGCGQPDGEADGHGEHSEHEEGHDHEDMMAITGEPSRDGLVMEDLEAVAGPLGVGLPGGLLVRATLDGDLIAGCEVRQTLEREEAELPPQPDAAAAWRLAQLLAEERAADVAPHGSERLLRIVSLEVERALSHVTWLHRFCRLLGWGLMTARARALLGALVEICGASAVERGATDLNRSDSAARLEEATIFVSRLARELAESRWLASRTHARGRLSAAQAASRQLAGPAARGSGVAADVRERDPAYAALGFEPTLEVDGDARARTLVRIREAEQSLALAARALRTESLPDGGEAPAQGHSGVGVVEGPRGPVRMTLPASGRARPAAPGSRAACAAAGELAEGCEWAAGLVTVASFDLSPWRVAG